MSIELTTPFSDIYDNFLTQITDDMYMELSEYETNEMLQDLLLAALPYFEFPRVDLTDYELETVIDETTYCGVDSDYNEVVAIIYDCGHFNCQLSNEEINIIATYMAVEWVGQQISCVDNVRMKYSGSDFKLTSQANHIQKLLQLKKNYVEKGFHLQRLYKRRKSNDNGIMKSTFSQIMAPDDDGGEW